MKDLLAHQQAEKQPLKLSIAISALQIKTTLNVGVIGKLMNVGNGLSVKSWSITPNHTARALFF